MPFEKGNKKAGSRKGVPNKATADARAAIGLFVDRNVPRLQAWLDAVASGIEGPLETAEDGTQTKTYLVEPDPQKAYEMVVAVMEFGLPKLARTEHTGKDGEDLPPVRIEFVG